MSSILLIIVSVHLALFVGAAGVAKLADQPGFIALLREHGVLPAPAAAAMGRAVPVLEVALALWLASGVAPATAYAAAAVLFAVFLTYRGLLYRHAAHLPCGCFARSLSDNRGAEVVGLAINTTLAMVAAIIASDKTAVYSRTITTIAVLGSLLIASALFALARRRAARIRARQRNVVLIRESVPSDQRPAYT